LTNPGIKILQDVVAISHKTTDDMVRAKPNYEELEPDIIHHMAGKCVIYNVEFESKFLKDEMKKEIGVTDCCMGRFSYFHRNLMTRNRIVVKQEALMREMAN
jgi:DNA polymerase III epsilon subunit-like protein